MWGSIDGRGSWLTRAAACAVAVLALVAVSDLPAGAALSQPAVVSDNASDVTPHIVLDSTAYSVYDFAQAGNTVFAGGRFLQVQDWAKTTTYSRQNFVAFDATTGQISPLELQFDGMVTSLAATDTALYIGGAFAHVNGLTRRGIMKYDLVNNRIDPTFAPAGMRTVSDIVIANGAVIAAGNFTKKVMALDPVTGADTGQITITVAGVVWTGDETRVQYLAVSPDGTRLVATGNFATVNGQSRKQAFMLNLGATATLSTWHAPRFDVDCVAAGARDVSAQGVDFSPDGSYFVVVATGGPTGTNGICDAAARFETANVAPNVQPTWINWTGGDSLYSVAVTGPAVYVGGHQRWLDNPLGHDSAGARRAGPPGHRRHQPGDRQGPAVEPDEVAQPRDQEAVRDPAGSLGRQRRHHIRARGPCRDRLRPAEPRRHAGHDPARHHHRLRAVGDRDRHVGHLRVLGERDRDLPVRPRRRCLRPLHVAGELHEPGHR